MKIIANGRNVYFFHLFFLFSTSLFAQNYKFRHLSLDKGLSNAQVNCILQDNQGFMWFGTNDGLNRYDGYSFKVYRKNLPNSTKIGLPSDIIVSICEDKDLNLWVGTANGLAKYNKDLDRFEYISEAGNEMITFIFLDDQANVWIGGIQQLAVRYAKTKKWEFLYHLFNQSHLLQSMAQTSAEDFWVGSNGQGLYHLHLPSKKITKFVNEAQNPNSLSDNTVYRVFFDKKQTLWIGTSYGGISKYDLKDKRFSHFKANPFDKNAILFNSIKDIYQDGKYILFAVENGGISSYNADNQVFTNFLHQDNNPYSLSDNSVRSMYRDRQGRLWVGTYSKGIDIWDKNAEKFDKLLMELPNQTINSILKDSRGRLWIGSENGIVVLDKNQTKVHQHHPQNPCSLSANPVLKIYEDSKKRIWIGTWLGGLNLYDEKNDCFKRFIHTSEITNAPNLNSIFALGEDSKQQVLIGSFGGLQVYNESKDVLEFYTTSKNIEYVWEIMQDSKGNLWVATQNGLHFLDSKNKAHILYENEPANKHSISHTVVFCVFEDSKKRIWAGTREGLNLLESPTKFKRFSTLDGLPSNQINDITEDKKGNLWLTTGQGLCKYNSDSQQFTNFTENDGLNSKQFQNNTLFQTTGGEVYVGSINGVNIFHPDSIKTNLAKPRVHLIDFKVFNKSVPIDTKKGILKKVIGQTKEITLNHQHSVFSFDFVALNFTRSNQNQYAYKMEGFENEWNYVGQHRTATYTNLDAGTYIFKVKAANNDGIWNEEGISIKIIVLPPWWETSWFRISLILLIIGIIFSAYKARTGFLKRQNQKLERIVLERTQEINQQKEEIETQSAYLQEMNLLKDKLFSIIAHDLRSPLNSLKGILDLLQIGSLSQASFNELSQKLTTNLNSTSGLLDNLLFWARAQMQGNYINSEKLDLKTLANEQCVLFEKTAKDKNILLSNQITTAVNVYADKNMIDLVLRNLVSNALKFCNSGDKVCIKAQTNIDFVTVEVCDTGVGIARENLPKLFSLNNFTTLGTKDEKGTGLGLMLCKEFVESLGGKIWAESELGRGTKFKFTLPIWYDNSEKQLTNNQH